MCTIRVLCGGRARSTDIDHKVRAEIYIERHDGDEGYFYDPDNLRGACHEDHSRKTALEQRGAWREPNDLTRGTSNRK